MSWLSRKLPSRRKTAPATSKNPASRHKAQPAVEALEDRWVPSAVSSVVGSFNGTAIPAGSTIWFNSVFQASNLPKNLTTATIHADNGSIDFTAGGTAYHVAVPNGTILLTPGATSASVSYDAGDNDWDVSAPTGGAGNTFLTGVAMPVATALPGGIKNVTWTENFWSDTAGVNVSWKWGAAVYSPFGTDYNALNVKPVDNNNLSAYKNGDHAGTPEAFKSSVLHGGTGDGGNNFTGNMTGGVNVTPSLGNGAGLYPYVSNNPLTSIAFNESTVLKASALDTTNGFLDVWYSDEHALALGISQVNVKTASGTTTTNYTVSPLTANPDSVTNPAIGATATTGDQAGTDVSGRPMTPTLYITDTTNNPAANSGDWQWGGTGYAPSAVFGTWKSFTKTVDYTTGNPAVSLVADVDPVKNNWNLGAGSDAPPAGTASEGYGAEIKWDLNALYKQGILQSGHSYRFYVMVHDGDQNKAGGDAGQAAYNYTYPGPVNQPPSSLSGFVMDAVGSAPEAGVTVTLTGTINGQPFTLQTMTDVNGAYSFQNLAPGTYTISETPPAGLPEAGTTLGTIGGTTTGTTDGVTMTVAVQPGNDGINYDFFNGLPQS
jgi:hypothetical protein